MDPDFKEVAGLADGSSIAAMGVREVPGVVSTFVPRSLIRPSVTVEEIRA